MHTAKKCEEWFANNPEIERLVAQANSPDLNLIENVWSETTREWIPVYPRNFKTLNEQVLRKREDLRMRTEYFQKLYDSMPARINAVIDANGGHTKY